MQLPTGWVWGFISTGPWVWGALSPGGRKAPRKWRVNENNNESNSDDPGGAGLQWAQLVTSLLTGDRGHLGVSGGQSLRGLMLSGLRHPRAGLADMV